MEMAVKIDWNLHNGVGIVGQSKTAIPTILHFVKPSNL